MRVSYLVLLLCLAVPLAAGSAACECPGRAELLSGGHHSQLMPTGNLGLYERPFSSLSDSEQWRVRIHGLRYAALHPRIWGGRKSERTENRRIVPIKPFYLRSSEHESYRLQEIRFDFKFQGRASSTMLGNNTRDPVLEIRFAEQYRPGEPGDPAGLDRGYVLRLSGYDGVDSGIFFRSHGKYVKVAPANLAKLEIDKLYTIKLVVTAESVEARLNGKPYAELRAGKLDRGLVGLISSWNPIIPKHLIVRGHFEGLAGDPSCRESGLIKLPSWNLVDAV